MESMMESSSQSVPPGNYISAIRVEGLFGEYSYSLERQSSFSDPRILVLYGRNGTGKTTILKLIKTMLSSDINAGHRLWLSQTPFKRVSIEVTGGVTIEAVRKKESVGPFTWSIKRDGVILSSLVVMPRNGGFKISELSGDQLERLTLICGELDALFPVVSYLDDNRTVIGKGSRSKKEPRWVKSVDGSLVPLPPHSGSDESDPVSGALSELSHNLRREAFLLSNRGNQGAQAIYTALVARLLSGGDLKAALHHGETGMLEKKLFEEQERSELLSKYGLVAHVDHSDMLRAIERGGKSQLSLVSTILDPYLESLSARFDALLPLHISIDQWVTELNDFIRPKIVNFRVGEEITLLSRSNSPLDASVLSSGERHLLFLLTKSFLMRGAGGLLVVDEPELSLNVEWQRNLVGAMVSSFSGSPCQLIVASHSLEIAAQFEMNVVEVG
jgi:predicted ATPase